ncbi:GNAT family N-acetyltransferase [Actinoplanes sp. KI2]|uniref:GNAT family N-acetyltransferase n=1 Tax=Actinoplanes sp. KI2 TaxID=2983315 RepID=UPI0021D5FA3B|nr:GNAT family N-acetyltransferase [Actinoplanes sp. KI2]MCU7728537.1 GNAT family N-acetyltransferase [Actinoplanes sp. KI2]
MLISLSEAELEARLPGMAADFAHAVTLDFGVEPELALAQSTEQLNAGLPDGVTTPGQLFFKAMDGADEVGFLWLSLPGTVFPDVAWLSQITVVADRRGRGYGHQIMAAAEAELTRRGVGRIGLHVFGHNVGARRLYLRLGYRIGAQARTRPIDPEPAPDATGDLTLAPMTPTRYAERLADLIENDPFAVVRRPEATAAGARRTVARLLPEGPATAGTLLRTAHAGGREVGWLWLSLPTAERPTTGLIAYVGVDPAERRKGHGRRIFAAVEAELARFGVPRIGLMVPGRAEALAFADTLDLAVASEQLYKGL